MKTLEFYKKNNEKLRIMISYQKYREEGKNIKSQFQKSFGW
jgi:hypothetical protein